MFKKVIIADDVDTINQGILSVLQKLDIPHIQQVKYCDDAYLKIKRGYQEQSPYQLLITDLSFKKDHREQTYISGEALTKQLKQEYPRLHIIIYTNDDRAQKVRTLMHTHNADAFVSKGRQGLQELTAAINAVYNGNTYVSPSLAHTLNGAVNLEIDDYDIALLEQLALGHSKQDISSIFKQQQVSPSSISSIEKRQNKLFVQFAANNATHLVAIVKDLGLI